MGGKKYSREAWINSKLFSGYQQDFLAVILSEPFYTKAEAQKVATAFFHQQKGE